ncbi:recombinase family protein [Zunongwangia sp. SCSIO 43204]|uniref:recombinase family protein n=1 Tax=Zunongwangia sp. SCSIO 43204 TaxID=2779359 RepID=UPI001CA84689|nr:recombinase family protein [Zunongwangia sp. SCSIO 43204]UAB83882.1 recombinase family protein [Zunongwangia sp. SCSIO 43204]
METSLIIARCSTNEKKQDVNRQIEELTTKYGNQYNVAEVYSYYHSGTKNQDHNQKILDLVKELNVQHIIVSEISRISRKVIDFLQFVEVTNEKGINIIIDNHGLSTLNSDGTPNIMTQTMLSIGASFAALELKQTQERLNSGRAKYIRDGGKLGRNEGTTETPQQFLAKHKDVLKHLKKGQSIRNTMKLTSKSNGTVQKVKKLMQL